MYFHNGSGEGKKTHMCSTLGFKRGRFKGFLQIPY